MRLAVSGCSAAHNVLVDAEGKAYTFGRNSQGQLGLDNTTSVSKPTLVPALEKLNIISAACGRNHTLFLTDTGINSASRKIRTVINLCKRNCLRLRGQQIRPMWRWQSSTANSQPDSYKLSGRANR